jgi:hypothetical protein
LDEDTERLEQYLDQVSQGELEEVKESLREVEESLTVKKKIPEQQMS